MSRLKNGHWLPGVSGNPQGRRPVPAEVKEMCSALVPEAVGALADALRGDDEKLRLQAARAILDRALGRPHQSASIETSNESGPQAHLAALMATATATQARLAASEGQRAEAVAILATGMFTPHPDR